VQDAGRQASAFKSGVPDAQPSHVSPRSDLQQRRTPVPDTSPQAVHYDKKHSANSALNNERSGTRV